jgi:CRISPR-associated exonuclease Cas4
MLFNFNNKNSACQYQMEFCFNRRLIMEETPDFVPISYLNAFAFCPRRFYLEFVLGEMVVNEFVLEGQQLHERVDQPGRASRDEKQQWRRIYLAAPILGLSGFCDLLEADPDPAETAPLDLAGLARSGQLYPVEYKKGKLGRWVSDRVQVCAQALALEEVLQVPAGTIRQGFVFYFGSSRREEVALDGELRAKTLALLAEARQVAAQDGLPRPITNRAKCRDCSLESICLPREAQMLENKLRRLTDGATLFD